MPTMSHAPEKRFQDECSNYDLQPAMRKVIASFFSFEPAFEAMAMELEENPGRVVSFPSKHASGHMKVAL